MSDLTRAPNGAYLIVSAAIAGYRDEMNHMLAADPIYLGPGK